jgi:hypothetical protein
MLITNLPIEVVTFRDLDNLRRDAPDPGCRLHITRGVFPAWHKTPGPYLNAFRPDGTDPSPTEGARILATVERLAAERGIAKVWAVRHPEQPGEDEDDHAR